MLIQSKDGQTTADPEFRAAIRDTEERLAQTVRTSPRSSRRWTAGNADQVSADSGSALIRSSSAATTSRCRSASSAPLAAVAEAQDGASGAARSRSSATPAPTRPLDEALDEDFQRAEFLSLPITLLILVVAFGALVAAGVPLLLGLTAVMATLGLLGPVSQLFPVDEADLRR